MYKVCRHIRTSGGRCRSAALANQNFCYYHLTQRQQSITLDLPPLEDRTSIQIAISRVLASLAAGMIDRRDAGMYLYGIQIAATNMCRDLDHIMPDNDVRRVVLTRENDQIAPPRTVFEEKDLNNHKKSCKCDDCTYTETDNPHHPDCRCGQCHFYAEEEALPEPAAAVNEITAEEPSAPDFVEAATAESDDSALLTLQATAEVSASSKSRCHPDREREEPAFLRQPHVKRGAEKPIPPRCSRKAFTASCKENNNLWQHLILFRPQRLFRSAIP